MPVLTKLSQPDGITSSHRLRGMADRHHVGQLGHQMWRALVVGALVTTIGGTVQAADAIRVEATTASANEDGLTPGVFTFKRGDDLGRSSGLPLTVSFTLTGTARSDKAGGYVFGFRQDRGLAGPFDNNSTGTMGAGAYFAINFPLTVSGGRGGSFFSPASGVVQSNGGQLLNNAAGSIPMTSVGAGYLTAPPAYVVDASANPGTGALVTSTLTKSIEGVTITDPGIYAFGNNPIISAAGGDGNFRATPNMVALGYVLPPTLTNSGGSGYDDSNPPAVTVNGGSPTATATVKALVTGGKVTGFTVTNAGIGYAATALTVTITAPAGTTATAKVSGVTNVGGKWQITSLTPVVAGAGYGASPTVIVDLSPTVTGTPAVFTGIVDAATGKITGYTLVSGGDYDSTPGGKPVSAPAPNGVQATASIAVAMKVASVTVNTPGNNYSIPAAITFTDSSGTSIKPATGFGTAGVLSVTVMRINDTVFYTGGGGYHPLSTTIVIPKPADAAANGYVPAVPPSLTPFIAGNSIAGINLNNSGFGYVLPVVTIEDTITHAKSCRAKPVVYGSSGPTATGIIDHIAVEEGGSGYSTPTVDISGGGGSGATAYVAVQNGKIIRATVATPGTGYDVPIGKAGGTPIVITLKNPGLGTPSSVATFSAVSAGQVTSIAVISGGSGYSPTAPPEVIIRGGGGTGATAKALVDATGSISSITMTGLGGKYTASPEVIVAGSPTGTGAVCVAQVGNGTIIDLVVTNPGAGYPTPTINVDYATAVTPPVVQPSGVLITVENGKVVDVQGTSTVPALNPASTFTNVIGGSGYAVPRFSATDPKANTLIVPPATTPAASPTALFEPILCGPDFEAPVNTTLAADGSLTGTVSFASGQNEVTVVIKPLRNGTAGARKVFAQIVPAINGTYSVGIPNSDTVSIADADSSISITTSKGTARANPLNKLSLPDSLPYEVQGRGEWIVTVDDTTRIENSYRRQIDFNIDRPSLPGTTPEAIQGTDYTLLTTPLTYPSRLPQYLPEAGTYFQTVVPQDATNVVSPRTGSTQVWTNNSIPVPANSSPQWLDTSHPLESTLNPGIPFPFMDSIGITTNSDYIFFGNPTDLNTGTYMVTNFSNSAYSNTIGVQTLAASMTFTPALQSTGPFIYKTQFNQTRVRWLGNKAFFKAGEPNTFSLFGVSKGQMFIFAIPSKTTLPGTGEKLVHVTLPSSADFQSITPTTAVVSVADSSATVNIQRINDAAQPVVAGVVQISSSRAFTRDIYIPIQVSANAGEPILGIDYTIAQVSEVTREGVVRLPAGSTSVNVDIVPKGATLQNPAAFTITLLTSPDYGLATASNGSTTANPSTQVNITPLLKTRGRPPGSSGGGTTTPIPVPVFLAAQIKKDGDSIIGNGIEGNATSTPGKKDVVFTVGLSDASGHSTSLTDSVVNDLSFTYVLNGTAISGVNYLATSGSATISASQGSVDVVIPVLNDGVVTDDLSLSLTVNAGGGFQVAGQNATGKIVDSSPVLSLAVNDADKPAVGVTKDAWQIKNVNPVAQDLTVPISVDPKSTAQVGIDYAALPASIIIPKNQSGANVSITILPSATAGRTIILNILPDPLVTKTYKLDLTTSTNNPSQTQRLVTILPGPVLPTISLVKIQDGAETTTPGTTPGIFKLVCSKKLLADLTINLLINATSTATSGLSADISGTDYQQLATTYTIKQGDIVGADTAESQTVQLVVFDDALVEGTERVDIVLAAGVGYLVSPETDKRSLTINITDNEKSVVGMVSTSVSATEGSTAQVTLKRMGSSDGAVTVTYQISNVTTTSGDYTVPTGPLTVKWEDKDSANKVISIPILADAVAEVSETIQVTLISVDSVPNALGNGGGQLGDVSTRTCTITIPINDSPEVEVSPNPRDLGDSSKSGCGSGSGIAALLGIVSLFLVSRRRYNRIH